MAKGAAYAGLGRPDSALVAWRRAREYWGGGTEAQDSWDRLPLPMAESSLQLGDTAQARSLLEDLVKQWHAADSSGVDVRRARLLFESLRAHGPPGLKGDRRP